MRFHDYIPEEVANDVKPRRYERPFDDSPINDKMRARIPVLRKMAVKTQLVRIPLRHYPPADVKFEEWLSIREHAAPKNRIEDCPDGVLIFSEFDESFVDSLKVAVPSHHRAWVGSAWFVTTEYADQARALFELFYGDDGNATPYY